MLPPHPGPLQIVLMIILCSVFVGAYLLVNHSSNKDYTSEPKPPRRHRPF